MGELLTRMIKVYKTVKEFTYGRNKKMYPNTMLVETSPNILKFGVIKVGNTQELLDAGFIVKVNLDRSYW